MREIRKVIVLCVLLGVYVYRHNIKVVSNIYKSLKVKARWFDLVLYENYAFRLKKNVCMDARRSCALHRARVVLRSAKYANLTLSVFKSECYIRPSHLFSVVPRVSATLQNR